MITITGPSWFSEHDRQRLNDALTDHQAPLADDRSPYPDVILIRFEFPSPAAAEQAVWAVFQVILQILNGHRGHRSIRTLRAVAHRLLGDVIGWAEPSLPATGDVRPRLDDAATLLRTWTARAMLPSWFTLSPTVPPATTAPRPSPSSPSRSKAPSRPPTGPFARQAEWLTRQMQLAGNVTANRLNDLGGPSGKTTKRLMKGLGTDRDEVWQKIIQGLNEAHRRAHRRDVLTIRDIPQD
jgi:hypothetical protein